MKTFLRNLLTTVAMSSLLVNLAMAADTPQINVSGSLNTVVKSQTPYQTTLDAEKEREGANWREDQTFRINGNAIFSVGTPEKHEEGLFQVSPHARYHFHPESQSGEGPF